MSDYNKKSGQSFFFALGLMIPNLSWNVRPVNFNTMQSTLTTWRKDYCEGSFEYNSTFEMIGWHAATQESKGCFGLYHNYELRALAQVYKNDDNILLRSINATTGCPTKHDS